MASFELRFCVKSKHWMVWYPDFPGSYLGSNALANPLTPGKAEKNCKDNPPGSFQWTYAPHLRQEAVESNSFST